MEGYTITPTMDLKKLISEAKEVTRAINEFIDELERIESKYETKTEDKEEE